MDWSVQTRARVSTLSDALRPRPVALNVVAVDEQPVREDPVVERARLAAEAEARGLEAGMKNADAAIAKACADAVRKAVAEHVQATERLDAATRALGTLLGALPDEIERVAPHLESVALEVAFEAVARVLGPAMADRDALRALCTQALAEHRHRPVVLRVHADDGEHALALATDDVRVVADATIARGACRIESAHGRYETSFESRLNAVRDALVRAERHDGDGTP